MLSWLSSWWTGDAWSSTGLEAARGDSAGGVIVLKGLTPVPKDMFGSEEIPVEVADAVLASVLAAASGAACEGESVACGESGLSSWNGPRDRCWFFNDLILSHVLLDF